MDEPQSSYHLNIWELPENLLFTIVGFVAGPTHRAKVILNQLAILCKVSFAAVHSSEAIWDLVLKEDYGSDDYMEGKKKTRSCKRLRRTPVDRVRDAHKMIIENTEIAFFYLYEMVNGSRDKLSKAKLGNLLREYGPHLRVNNVVSSGGLFLVEVCRARNVKENVILKCVVDLVENQGAMVDLQSSESPQSHQTALCVAAARGMPSVVKYLLQKGATRTILSSGRFRLHSNPKKTIRCSQCIAIQFARAMRDGEKEAGASESSLAPLDKCIRLLLD